MFQFGYELQGTKSAGLLAIDSLANACDAVKLVDDAHKFNESITVYTNSDHALKREILQHLEEINIKVDDRKIIQLSQGPAPSEVIIEFENDERVLEGFLVHQPLTKLNHSLADQLNLSMGPIGKIMVTPPFNQTSLALVYAAGDCASPMKIVPSAIAMGAYAGAGIARDLPK